ncbi:MAG: pimeloyl-ACP methyl ester esterase BioH [Pseudomonadota bacterium]|nr:pimeloyl-[acyl-carrier protein] methyl ester esterase [Pseudomonadales bacterium]MDY6920135.1 pimeloyl-ACP methyl ester esterase BioH [Pseudomonadota bacterium]
MSLTLYHDRFRCTGDLAAPPEMVVLHGWGMHSLVWDEVMPALLAHFQVTVVDLPGLGRSPMPGGEYNLDYLVQHVLAVAPARALWLGWSLGGMVALRAAHQFPQRVTGLITVASSPRFVAGPQWPLGVEPKVLEAFSELLLEDTEGTLIRFLSLQCKDSDTIKQDIRTLKELLYFHGLPARRALLGGQEILRSEDLRQELSQLQCPSLHVFGERDNLVPVGVSEAVQQLRPAAQTAVIRGVAHLPFLSAPGLFVAACRDFLQDHQWL